MSNVECRRVVSLRSVIFLNRQNTFLRYSTFIIDSLVKSRIGERHCPFRKKGFDTGGVKNSKLFEELATSSWNLAAGVETPEWGHRSEPI